MLLFAQIYKLWYRVSFFVVGNPALAELSWPLTLTQFLISVKLASPWPAGRDVDSRASLQEQLQT